MENSTSYIDRNSKYSTGGNAPIDQLLYSIESMDVLSEKFKTNITGLALWILTNHKGHARDIEVSIHKLNEDLHFVNIFSFDFTSMVISKLKQGLANEMYKDKQRETENA